MPQTPFEKALALYEAAEQDGSPGSWALAVEAATTAAVAEPDDPEASYLAGLCAYYADDTSATRRYLTRALSLQPGHAFARLYLGHQLYDEGRFGDALEAFERVDGSVFLDFGQHWRSLKLDELRLCCRLYLGDANLASHVARLAKAYRESAEEDKALPAEIVECVGSLDLGTRIDGRRIGETVLGLAEAEDMESAATLIRHRLAS